MLDEALSLRDEVVWLVDSVLEAYSSVDELFDLGGMLGLLKQMLVRAEQSEQVKATKTHKLDTFMEIEQKEIRAKSKTQRKAEEAARKADNMARKAEVAADEERRKAELKSREARQHATHQAAIAAAKKKAEEAIATRKVEESKGILETKRKEEVQKALEAHQALMKKKDEEAAVMTRKEEDATLAAAAKAAEQQKKAEAIAMAAAAKREGNNARAARRAQEAVASLAARKQKEEAKAMRMVDGTKERRFSLAKAKEMAKEAAERLQEAAKEASDRLQEEAQQRKQVGKEAVKGQREVARQRREAARLMQAHIARQQVQMAGRHAHGQLVGTLFGAAKSEAQRGMATDGNSSSGHEAEEGASFEYKPRTDAVMEAVHDVTPIEKLRASSTAANISSERLRRGKTRKSSIISRLRSTGDGKKRRSHFDDMEFKLSTGSVAAAAHALGGDYQAEQQHRVEELGRTEEKRSALASEGVGFERFNAMLSDDGGDPISRKEWEDFQHWMQQLDLEEGELDAHEYVHCFNEWLSSPEHTRIVQERYHKLKHRLENGLWDSDAEYQVLFDVVQGLEVLEALKLTYSPDVESLEDNEVEQAGGGHEMFNLELQDANAAWLAWEAGEADDKVCTGLNEETEHERLRWLAEQEAELESILQEEEDNG